MVSEEEKIEYLLNCLSCADAIRPNWASVVLKTTGQESDRAKSNRAQQKFKRYVEESGRYKLIEGKIVEIPDAPETPKKPTDKRSTPSTPKPTPVKASAPSQGPPAKKRKIDEEGDDEEVKMEESEPEEGEIKETPSA